MTETPRETLEKWMLTEMPPRKVREAIRAVLAESKTEQEFTNKYIKRLHAAEAEVERLTAALKAAEKSEALFRAEWAAQHDELKRCGRRWRRSSGA